MGLLKTAFGVVGFVGVVLGAGAALAEDVPENKPRVVLPAVTDGIISLACDTQLAITKNDQPNSIFSKHHYDLNLLYKDGKIVDVVQDKTQEPSAVGNAITACSPGIIFGQAAASPASCIVSNFRDGAYFVERAHEKSHGAQIENAKLNVYGFLSVDAKQMYFIWYDGDENGLRGKYTKGIEAGACTFK